jgi:hypothetical protein
MCFFFVFFFWVLMASLTMAE